MGRFDNSGASMTTSYDRKSTTGTIPERIVAQLRNRAQSDEEIFASLQQELRSIARSKMRHERPDHTLQATALVNEAFIKVFQKEVPPGFWLDLTRAVRLIAHAMEQILNDHADAHNSKKRGGRERLRVPLDEQQAREFGHGEDQVYAIDSSLLTAPEQSESVLAVQETLSILKQTFPRQAEVLQLQFYAGLTQEEIASLLDLSLETVKLDTRKGKAFLKEYLFS
jgi:RNA polymerase sigma factor (TIGR02999 family)